VQLRRERRDEAALAQFQRAYALRPTPRVRAQAGLAEQALGRWAAAEADLQAAMATKSDPWIVRNHDELAEALLTIAQHLGTIEVTANVAGAELRINGTPAGALPQGPARVEAGEVTLEASAPHRATVRRTLFLHPGASVREDLFFADPVPPPAAPVVDARQPAASTPPSAPVRADTHASTQRTWGWIALGSAGAFAGLGVVGTLLHESHVSHYNDDPSCQPKPSVNCASDREAGNRAVVVSAVGYGLAGLLAVTGTVLLVTAPKSRVSLGAWAWPESFGATAAARF
jgi:hypothetical protein